MGKLYFRKISPYFTREALRIGLSANQVTYIMIFFGLLGAWSFAIDGPIALLGFIGIQIYLLLDCVDGEVARFKKTEGARGVYLDRWGHYVVEGSIILNLSEDASKFPIIRVCPVCKKPHSPDIFFHLVNASSLSDGFP